MVHLRVGASDYASKGPNYATCIWVKAPAAGAFEPGRLIEKNLCAFPRTDERKLLVDLEKYQELGFPGVFFG